MRLQLNLVVHLILYYNTERAKRILRNPLMVCYRLLSASYRYVNFSVEGQPIFPERLD